MTRIEQHWDAHGFGPWALDVRGDFAGILGLKWVPPDMPFAPAVELLYRIIPRFWGQGLATEGSLAALEFGFCELQLDAVVAFAVEANTGSRRVMEKVGMVYGSDFNHPAIPECVPCGDTFFLRSNALTGTRSLHQFASWCNEWRFRSRLFKYAPK